MRSLVAVVRVFVALSPVVTAALWVAGGVLFRLLDERAPPVPADDACPGVTVLIPAYDEEAVIAASVAAVLASDYPVLEVLVLDDGSKDRTAEVARAAAAGDRRREGIGGAGNRGKART